MNKAKQNTKENLSEKLHFLIGRLNRKKNTFSFIFATQKTWEHMTGYCCAFYRIQIVYW